MTNSEGIALASALKEKLLAKGLPVHHVFLFGSFAQGKTHDWSDVDIAVVCDKFRDTRHEENVEFLSVGHDIDLRIETVCLHPEDFENKYSTLVSEVKKHGISV
jgi:predicted nucleotidyltransferase